MLIIAQQKFIGANLEINPKKLGDGYGTEARNMRLGGADLAPWNSALSVFAITAGATQRRSLYRMGRALPSDTLYWLSSVNDVDYVRSLIALDSAERTYYTGESEPRVTDTDIALAGEPYPSAFRTLGIPAPGGAIVLSPLVAGTGDPQTRVVVDTFVSDRGEESAPNPNPQSITIAATGTVTVSGLAPPPGGSHGITLRRLYVSTGGDYRRFAQQAANLTTAVDSLARGAVLPSGGSTTRPAWLTPPADLRGLIGLWNGMMGGFVGKSVRVCYPFQPHAWPLEYEKLVTDEIVATGKWLQNWLILTVGRPRLFVGSSPSSLSEVPAEIEHACVAKKSVASLGHGVCWAAGDGLAYMGQGARGLVTQGIIKPEQWRARFNPSTLVGARLENYYYGSFVNPTTGLRDAFLIDPLNPASSFIELDQGAHATFYDELQDQLYLLDTTNVVRKWNAGSPLTARFVSGIKRHPYPTNPGAAQVIADTYPVTFRLYSEQRNEAGVVTGRVMRHERTVVGPEPFRLPGGYMAQEFSAEVAVAGSLQAFMVAEDISDLDGQP